MTDPSGLDALAQLCADEPIHTPGAVQPHGALLALEPDATIVVASANSRDIVGRDPAQILGQRLSSVLTDDITDSILAGDDGEVILVDGPVGLLEVITHRAGGHRLVELEPASASQVDTASRLHRALRGFHGAASLDGLVGQAAQTVQELTGFDRVLVYRFDTDWNGEVVAEVVRPEHASFLGLRFPASDIPPQARELYSRARLRLIPDANAATCPLVAVDRARATTLDLSDVALRAVSPVHLRYLQNMGVVASMSVAIHRGERLWGLIACHNLSGPLRPSLRTRDAIDLVGQTTSTLLAALIGVESSAAQITLLRQIDALVEPLWSELARDPDDVLAESEVSLLALMGATGAAVVSRSRIRVVGICPPLKSVNDLVNHARTSGVDGLAERQLSSLDATWRDYAHVAAGAVVVPVDVIADRWLIWFRPETEEIVRWGGDPSAKEPAVGARGQLRLEPRASFEEYLQKVDGQSTEWLNEQIGAAHALARRLAEAHAGSTLRVAEVAAVIQRTVMLEDFPEIPSVSGFARYVPSAGNPIGGDWYDVIFRPAGGPILAVGDVAGHGMAAAATMAQLRHALRAYIVREATVGEAMSRLNDLIIALLPGELATVLLIAINPDACTAEVVNAGHLPPAIIGPEPARFVDTNHGPAIGVLRGARYESTLVPLPANAMLVAYTDGLIERRTRDIDESLADLLRIASARPSETVQELCDRVLETLGAEPDLDDDVTIVAIRLLAQGVGVESQGSVGSRARYP